MGIKIARVTLYQAVIGTSIELRAQLRDMCRAAIHAIVIELASGS